MHVFVTGASGFAGGHIAAGLIADGHTVSAMARSARSADKVRALGATPVSCDLSDIGPAHLAGVDAVVHAAAFVEEYGTREQFWAANVDGTARLLEAARAAGVSRFVHIGTEAAFFVGQDLLDLDETVAYPTRQRFLYSETKAEAERRVLAASAPGFHTVSLRPRLIWGPGDATVMPTVKKMAEEGRFSWIDGGRARSSTAHVMNLVAAVKRALVAGPSGRAYFIADDGETTVREFLTALLATQGVQLPGRSIPGWLARASATAAEALWRGLSLSGAPPLVAFSTTMMSRSVTVRTEAARRDLGWTPVITREQGLAELAASAA